MSDPLSIQKRTRPISATVRPPGSKSLTIRALTCAALAQGESVLRGALDSDDTIAARTAFRQLGVGLADSGEEWVVSGSDARLRQPAGAINAGASGLTARILLGLAPLVRGTVTVTGGDRLPERPMDGVLDALAQEGVKISSREGRLPATVVGEGRLRGGQIDVSAKRSSQFVTALLLAAPTADTSTSLLVKDLTGSRGYLDLTLDVMGAFGAQVKVEGDNFRVENRGYRGAAYLVEPDASAAVYPMMAAALTGGRVTVEGLGPNSKQPDFAIVQCLEQMGCVVEASTSGTSVTAPDAGLQSIDVDLSESPDGALAVAVGCVQASGPSTIRGLESLRYKESDRLDALVTEINRVGGRAEAEGSTLRITPGAVKPAVIETYSDHRVAMSFALLGLVADGIRIRQPEVVNKTWPGFWEMLEAL